MYEQICKLLQYHPWCENIQYFDTIASTNDYAKQLASQGAPEGTIVIAGQQTGGRGRMGRTFSSPKDMGVYFSIILRPVCKPTMLMHLTCSAGVAGCDAVKDACGIKPSVKWTNDLILGNKKLGGILTELSTNTKNGHVDWVVIGIGINCCQTAADFPAEIRSIACSLGIAPEDRAKVAASLVESLYRMAQNLLTKKAQILAAYRANCVTLGQQISILRGENVSHGKALDIDADGALIIQLSDGTVETVSSGEVSVRGMYGYL